MPKTFMERFWEIDVFRGIAVILMVIFNYIFALRYLNIYSFDGGFLFWWLFPRLIAGTFIFIAGMSVWISYSALKDKKPAYKRYISRGLKIFSLGILITAITFSFIPSSFVAFGILHFIGLAVIISPLFLRPSRKYLLIAAFASLAIGIYLQNFPVSFPWLLWLGFVPENFSSIDYFPFFPWFGIFLLGLYSSGFLYNKSRRLFKAPKEPASSKFVSLLGRNSLTIYMLHQPLLIIILMLLNYRIL